MPNFIFSFALGASQLGGLPLTGWQYEYLPWPAQVILMMRAAATGVNATVYSGSETIVERSPVQAGGTAGVTPSELNTAAHSWIAGGGDRLKVVLDNTIATATTVDGIIIVNPA